MTARRWTGMAPNGEPETGIAYWCAGCGCDHNVPTTGPRAWEWNGDLERPVLNPSQLTTWTTGEGDTRKDHVCHTYVGRGGAEPGQIIYLKDTTHDLAGQVVNLQPFPWEGDV